MGRAVFLDRDGTINREVEYLRDPEQLELLPGVARAIKLLNDHGLLAVVVSNQSGIGRGYLTEETLREVHQRMQDLLAEEGAFVDAIYYCPHPPGTNCDCRKPEIGLLRRAASDLGVDLICSYVVGDKWSDIEMGRRAGCKTILVLTGYGEEEQARSGAKRVDFIACDLISAVEWILRREEKRS